MSSVQVRNGKSRRIRFIELVDAGRGGVRPEVAATVLQQLPGPFDPRKVLAQADLDIR